MFEDLGCNFKGLFALKVGKERNDARREELGGMEQAAWSARSSRTLQRSATEEPEWRGTSSRCTYLERL